MSVADDAAAAAAPSLRFRNYTPSSEALAAHAAPHAAPHALQGEGAAVAAGAGARAGGAEEAQEAADLATVLPRKPDWDLKVRDGRATAHRPQAGRQAGRQAASE